MWSCGSRVATQSLPAPAPGSHYIASACVELVSASISVFVLFPKVGRGIYILPLYLMSADALGHVLPQNLLMSDDHVHREHG